MERPRATLLALSLVAATLTGGCLVKTPSGASSPGDSTHATAPAPTAGPPASLSILAGNAQTGAAGTALPVALAVQVLDAKKVPVPDIAVSWSTISGGLRDSVTHTDTAGIARTAWTLSTKPGSVTATALTGTTLRASFKATVVAASAATITLTPSSVTLVAIGSTQAVTAKATDAYGNAVNRTFRWAVSDSTMASVSATGLVTAKRAGTTALNASADSARVSIAVVVDPRVSKVTVSPASATLLVGDTVLLDASATDAKGVEVGNAPLAWSSTVPAVAVVDARGKVTAMTVGVTSVAAKSTANLTGSSRITVVRRPIVSLSIAAPADSVAAGSSLQLAVTGKEDHGADVARPLVTWASGNPAVATVSAAGLVSGKTLGQVAVLARVDQAVDSVVLRVVHGAPTRLTLVSGSGQTAPVATTLPAPIVVLLTDALGNPVAGQRIAFASAGDDFDPDTALTDGEGKAATRWTLGVAAGAHSGTAKVAGITTPLKLTATATSAPVAFLELGPSPLALTATSKPAQITVKAYDAAGNVIAPVPPVTWSTSVAAVADVSAAGQVTPKGNGTATITATAGAVTGTDAVTVTGFP